jgi:hypothetical protein
VVVVSFSEEGELGLEMYAYGESVSPLGEGLGLKMSLWRKAFAFPGMVVGCWVVRREWLWASMRERDMMKEMNVNGVKMS